jgi:1,4-alpha-glucan branching enzyme
MPGDTWQKFANLRLSLASWRVIREKLSFMGGEFGQWNEWNHDKSIDWHLIRFTPIGLSRNSSWTQSYLSVEPALYEVDLYQGFEWIDFRDTDNSTISLYESKRPRRFPCGRL